MNYNAYKQHQHHLCIEVNSSSLLLSMNSFGTMEKQYYLPNKKEECMKYENRQFCKLDGPLLFKDRANECIYNLFMNKTETNCSYRPAKDEEWKKVASNKWMYHVSKAQNISIICNESKFEAVVNGTGTIETNENCQKITERQKLRTEKNIITNARQTQLHQVAGSVTLHSNVNKIKKDLDTLFKSDHIQLFHHCHHYIVIYVIVLLLAMSSIYIYKELTAPSP